MILGICVWDKGEALQRAYSNKQTILKNPLHGHTCLNGVINCIIRRLYGTDIFIDMKSKAGRVLAVIATAYPSILDGIILVNTGILKK